MKPWIHVVLNNDASTMHAYNACLIDLPETPDSVPLEEVPDMHITYCTISAVESTLKQTSIPENVIERYDKGW